ncbi:MAG: phosphotransferase [Planctomycetes bacterium]|nr:phosphotransferase [Planctomycetota bacterium]
MFRPLADEPLASVADGLVLRRMRCDPSDASGCATAMARLRAEAGTLRVLEALPCDFDAPRSVCFAEDPDGVARGFIETALMGWPLKLFKEGDGRSRAAISAIARAAAAIHGTPTECFTFLPSHIDSRTHLLAELAGIDSACAGQSAHADAAITWIHEHLPAERPAVLLHGDLLPQNLLLDLESQRLAVVDWEYAKIGDPACDLAIVTRGNRRLLGIEHGVRGLVDAYREAGGEAIEPADVVVWELVLVLRWLKESAQAKRAGKAEGQPPDFYQNQLRAILRRARG